MTKKQLANSKGIIIINKDKDIITRKKDKDTITKKKFLCKCDYNINCDYNV